MTRQNAGWSGDDKPPLGLPRNTGNNTFIPLPRSSVNRAGKARRNLSIGRPFFDIGQLTLYQHMVSALGYRRVSSTSDAQTTGWPTSALLPTVAPATVDSNHK